MRYIVAWLSVVAIVLSLVIATGTGDRGVKAKRADPLATVQAIQTQQAGGDAEEAAEAPGDLDARIGGSRASWEAAYGDPIAMGGSMGTTVRYDLPGFRSVLVDFYEDRVISIGLFAPSESGWLVPTAYGIAQQFLPRDGKFEGPRFGSGYVVRTVLSDALDQEVPASVYEYVDNTPIYGAASNTLFLNGPDRVDWIFIDFVVDDPLLAEQEVAVEEPAAAQHDGQLTAAEEQYAKITTEQMETMTGSFDRFTELMDSPGAPDESWLMDVMAELAIWTAVYEEAQTLDVPPLFFGFHATYLGALAEFSAAAYDITTGTDTQDESLLERAGRHMAAGFEEYREAERILDEVKEQNGL